METFELELGGVCTVQVVLEPQILECPESFCRVCHDFCLFSRSYLSMNLKQHS